MADMAKFMAALMGIGETLNRATNATQDEFQLVSGCNLDDMKAAAAYHPLDPRVFAPSMTFTSTPDPMYKDPYFIPGNPSKASMREVRRKVAQGGKFLQITKSPNIYHLRVSSDDERNLLNRESEHHFGDWHVEEIENDRPRLLESFDHFDEAVAYVSQLLSNYKDEDVHEYASVGEVPC